VVLTICEAVSVVSGVLACTALVVGSGFSLKLSLLKSGGGQGHRKLCAAIVCVGFSQEPGATV